MHVDACAQIRVSRYNVMYTYIIQSYYTYTLNGSIHANNNNSSTTTFIESIDLIYGRLLLCRQFKLLCHSFTGLRKC